MKRTICSVSALLLAISGPAFAQLNLAWNGCPGAGVSDIADVCAAPATLFGTYELLAPIPKATAADYVMEFQADDPTTAGQDDLPTFWQRAGGECNGRPPITFLSFYSPSDTGCSMPTGLGGDFGSDLSVTSASWFSGTAIASSPNQRAKLVGSVVRSFPTTIGAGVQFFGKWTIANSDTGRCKGCDWDAAIVWNSLVIHCAPSGDERSEPVTLAGPGSHPNFVSISEGGPPGAGCPLCGTTSKPKNTWGRIESLYR